MDHDLILGDDCCDLYQPICYVFADISLQLQHAAMIRVPVMHSIGLEGLLQRSQDLLEIHLPPEPNTQNQISKLLGLQTIRSPPLSPTLAHSRLQHLPGLRESHRLGEAGDRGPTLSTVALLHTDVHLFVRPSREDIKRNREELPKNR